MKKHIGGTERVLYASRKTIVFAGGIMMNQKKRPMLKIEADIGADPVWCATSGENLELAHFSLPAALEAALYDWNDDYGTWIDWETDDIVAGAVALEFAHNARGEQLTEQVRQALAGQYDVIFSPSTFAKRASLA